ncbi:hypothetical protein [Paracoccus liaowanqingii]|nr:hypothetical protein [Paracoccus liaowanqingii]
MLINLPAGVLSVDTGDTGDTEVNAMLMGHIPIITGPDLKILVKVRA